MVADARATLGADTLRVDKTFKLRPLNMAEPVDVRLDGHGLPATVRREGDRPRAVVEVLDQWRIDDEWWRDRPVSRMYQVLLLENGTRLTVYQDLLDGSWYEQRDTKHAASQPPPNPAQRSRYRKWVAKAQKR